MILKASYLALSLSAIGLMLFEAPRGKLLTGAPERGRVEQQAQATPQNPGRTVRAPFFVFVGGYHGGK